MIRRIRLIVIGLVVALVFQRWLNNRQAELRPATVDTGPKTAAPAASKGPDPLTEINGIGPAFETALNAIGIHTFAELAGQQAEDLAQRLSVRVTAERIRRDAWIEQAAEKAKGD